MSRPHLDHHSLLTTRISEANFEMKYLNLIELTWHWDFQQRRRRRRRQQDEERSSKAQARIRFDDHSNLSKNGPKTKYY